MPGRYERHLDARQASNRDENDPFPLSPAERARRKSAQARAGFWLAGIAGLATERALSSFEKANRENEPRHVPREIAAADPHARIGEGPGDAVAEGSRLPGALAADREADQGPDRGAGFAAAARPGAAEDDTTVEIVGTPEDLPLGPQLASEFEDVEGGYGGASGGSAGLGTDGLTSLLSNRLGEGGAFGRGSSVDPRTLGSRLDTSGGGGRGISDIGILAGGGAPAPLPPATFPGQFAQPPGTLPPVKITFALLRDGGADAASSVTLGSGRVVAAGPGGFLTATSDAVLQSVTFASGMSVGTQRSPAVSLSLDEMTRSGSLALAAPYGAIEGVAVTGYDGAALSLVNWMRTVVLLETAGPLSLVVDGVIEGAVRLMGTAPAQVRVLLEGGAETAGHAFLVETGSGNDVVTIGETQSDPIPGRQSGRATAVTIATGAGDDVIVGGTGDDTVDGGSGRDVFVLNGLRSGFSLLADGDGILVRDIDPSDGDLGTDRVRNVEVFRFADGTEIVIDANRPANRAPVAVADPEEIIRPGETLTVVAAFLVANDTDADGDVLWASTFEATTPAGGTVAEEAPGTWLYTPPEGFVGTDTILYVVTDGFGGSVIATLRVAVVNSLPVFVPDADLTVPAGGSASFVAAHLLANDTDADGDALSIGAFEASTERGGTVEESEPGVFVYIPPEGFVGIDRFSYTVVDGYGGEATGVLVLKVVNTPPVQVADAPLRLPDGAPVSFSGATLAANDFDAEGHAVIVRSVFGLSEAGGTVVRIDADTWLYTPPAGLTGEDRITYTIADSYGGTAQATLAAIVGNRAPVASDDGPFVLRPGGTVLFSAETLAINDRDPDGDPLSVALPGGVTAVGGRIEDLGAGMFAYTAPAGFTGIDSATYTVSDPYGRSDTALVLFRVINGAPDPMPDVPLRITAGDVGLIALAALLVNDTDPDDDWLSIAGLAGTTEAGGTVIALARDVYLYAPPEGFTGTDTVTYTVHDSHSAVREATFSLVVAEPGPPAEGTPPAEAGAGSPFALSFSNDLRLFLDGSEDQDNAASLADGAIGPEDAVDDTGEPLTAALLLGEGGLGPFRTVAVTDLGGDNTLLAGPAVRGPLVITTGDGDDFIEGGAGRDTISAGGGNNRILGHGGRDIISAGDGNDEIDGGDGDDVINAGRGDNRVMGGAGDDLIITSVGDDVIDGGDGDDDIRAGDGRNQITGGAGNDRITAGRGDDRIDGGDGDDVIDAGEGANEIAGGAGNDMIRAGSGNDVIRGDEGDDTIHAGAGDDHVEGGAGNDSILGGAGDDVIDGGDGDDTIDGGEGDDVLFGGAGNDRLSGGDGDDRIDGGDGDDVIEGGEGDDTIIDGAGSDRIVMDGGNDRVLNARDGARDVFVWADRDALARTPEWDTLSVFDTDHRTGDQLDLSGLGDGLVAELYGGGEGQNGLFAVYMSEGDRLAGNYMLAIEWVEQIGNGRILVSPSTQAKIKIGLGWSIIDVLGDPYA